MDFKRILALVLACLATLGASAAPALSERSPFFQGHWWDPAYSGSGFEIFNAAGNVMAVWYTYNEQGRPVWYTAQGKLAEMGKVAWPLQKHTWAGGRISSSTTVGEMRLKVDHAEQVVAQFSIGTGTGQWTLRPYIASSVISEVDHTGHWYDASQSGWGFTLTEQGNTLGSVLYAYDSSGAPTWVAGFGSDSGNRVAMYSMTGTAPTAIYKAPSLLPVGHIEFQYEGESRLVVKPALQVALASDLRIAGAQAMQLGRPASLRAADRQLAHFDSEPQLKAFLDDAMLNARPAGSGIDFSAPPPAAVFSPTNVQEEGVDEADLVKTDGRFVYTLAKGTSGKANAALRYVALGADGASLGDKGAVQIANVAAEYSLPYAGMMVHAGRVATIHSTVASSTSVNPWYTSGAWTGGNTLVEIFDAADSGLPVSRWRAKIDGHVIATRRVGNLLYVVTRFVPDVPGFYFGAYSAQDIAANRAILAGKSVIDLLPRVSINGNTSTSLLAGAKVFVPPAGAALALPDMITTVAIDITSPGIVQTLGIVGGAETVYASTGSLYIASSRTKQSPSIGQYGFVPYNSQYLTDFNRIALSPSGMTVVGTGTVEGMLNADPEMAPLRMSEKDGRLRVVTTSYSMWGSDVSHRLTILEPSSTAPGLLRVVSWLPNASRPQPIGKPGEQLYATRFVGDRLFAVTFRRIDPLYVVDLSRPEDPKISGLVEMPGFAEYLHPLANGQILGFGRDTDAAGRFAGLMLALYNVDAAGVPSEAQRLQVGGAGSASALLDQPHAFSALMKADTSGTIAFPARITALATPPSQPVWQFSGVVRFDLLRATPTELRLVPATNMVTHTGSESTFPSYQDPAVLNGRSILFPKGTVYVGNGSFWHMNESGASTGPY